MKIAQSILDTDLPHPAQVKLQRAANAIARKHGYGPATDVVLGAESKIISHIPYGCRKYSNDEYVSNAYRSSFGWKNTYYQHAKTTVMIDARNYL